MLNFYPTIQVAVEQRLTDNLALQADGGVVIPGFFQTETASAFDKKGFKAKLDLRYYIQPNSKYWRFYVAPEAYLNFVNYKKEERFGINCEEGECDYFQDITYGMQYREPGVNLKTGAVFHVYRFSIDFQAGFGVRFINYTATNKPSGDMYSAWNESDNVFFFNFDPKEKDNTAMSPIVCIRFGYILK